MWAMWGAANSGIVSMAEGASKTACDVPTAELASAAIGDICLVMARSAE